MLYNLSEDVGVNLWPKLSHFSVGLPGKVKDA